MSNKLFPVIIKIIFRLYLCQIQEGFLNDNYWTLDITSVQRIDLETIESRTLSRWVFDTSDLVPNYHQKKKIFKDICEGLIYLQIAFISLEILFFFLFETNIWSWTECGGHKLGAQPMKKYNV